VKHLVPPPTLGYAFPLRDTFNASLILPTDLTDEEADRLAAFIKSLVTPWRVEPPEPEPAPLPERYRLNE
jgi:hypothetical protein